MSPSEHLLLPAPDDVIRQRIELARLYEEDGLAASDLIRIGSEMLEKAELLGDPGWIAKAHAKQALGYGLSGSHLDALNHYTSAISLLDEDPPNEFLIGLRSKREAALAYLGKTLESYTSSLETLILAKELGNPAQIVESMITVANNELWNRNNEEALTLLEQAVHLCKEHSFNSRLSQCLLGMAQVAAASGDSEGQLRYASEAIENLSPSNRGSMRAGIEKEIGAALIQLGRSIEAFPYLQEANLIAREVENLDLQVQSHHMLSMAYFYCHDIPSALQDGAISLKLARSATNTRSLSSTLSWVARVASQEGDYLHARDYLLESASLAEGLGSSELLCPIHEGLSQTYELLGEPVKALEHFKLHAKYHNEHISEAARTRMEALSISTGLEKKTVEAKVAQERAFWLERELGNSTLQLISQTELLEELRNDLLRMVRKIPPSEPVAKELRDRLRNLPCKSVDWEKFDTQFKAAHPEFSKKLLGEYPDLTPTELRICSLLLMNMKSSDIARLFCLSERSVEGHRFNIRKKLKLARETDLVVFLTKM